MQQPQSCQQQQQPPPPQQQLYPQQHSPTRPESDRISHLTIETVLSADFFSDHTGSTALTSPTIASPKFPWGAKRHSNNSSSHSLGHIVERPENNGLPLGLSPPPPGTDYSSSSISRSALSRSTMYSMYESPNSEHYSSPRPAPAVHDTGPALLDATALRYSSNNDYSDNDYRDDPSPGMAPAPEDVRRGPSVRSRASEIDASSGTQQHDDESRRSRHLSLPSAPSERPRSTSPHLRLPTSRSSLEIAAPVPQFAPSPTAEPQRTPRALPIPPVSPLSRARSPLGVSNTTAASLEASPSPTQLVRGQGSARRMIAAWENNTPTRYDAASPSPSPMRNSPGGSNPMQWSQSSARIPMGGLTVPTPLGSSGNGDQSSPPRSPLWSSTSSTFKRKSADLTNLVVAHSPDRAESGKKSPFKRSPFKELKNVVIKGLRHGKNKDKEDALERTSSRTYMNLDEDSDWFAQPKAVSAVPTGVFSERMGLEEGNEVEVDDANTIRSTAVIYLAPNARNGDRWLTSWATLTPDSLKIVDAPLQRDGPVSRIQMGLATPYSHIPRPHKSELPMYELALVNCADVRSLRKDEIRARQLPLAPEGVGTEVLELVVRGGYSQYIGVEGVAGRLSWLNAIWDALVAAKRANESANDRPASISNASMRGVNPLPLPQGSHDPPVQKMGDQWVKSGDFVGESASLQGSASVTPETKSGNGSGFRGRERFPSLEEMDAAPRVPDPVIPGLPPVHRSPVFTPENKEADFEPVANKPTCTLPLNVHKRKSVPDALAMEDAPPVPPKKPIGSLVEERRRMWTGNATAGPPTPPKALPTPPTTDTTPRMGTSPHLSSVPSTPQLPYVSPQLPESEPQALRESLVKMFNKENQPKCPPSDEGRRRLRSETMEARIRAWQQTPDNEPMLNPLSRNGSKHEVETQLSFADSDLNPSRSASQVRHSTSASVLGGTSDDTQAAGLTGLGIGMTSLRNIPPVTRKAVPKFDEPPAMLEVLRSPRADDRLLREDMPQPSRLLSNRSNPSSGMPTPSRPFADRLEEATTPEMPRPSRLLAERTKGVAGPRSPMPKPSRLLADRSLPASPASTYSALPEETRSTTSSGKLRGPKSSLPKVSSASNLPKLGSASNLSQAASSSSLPKLGSMPNLPKVASSSNLPKVASSSNLPKLGSMSNLPKVASSAPRTPAAETSTLLDNAPEVVQTSSTLAPPVPSKSPLLAYRPLSSSLEPPLSAPAPTSPRSPTPRLQSRVLAAASVFEPTIAIRTLGAASSNTSTPSPSKRRKPVPSLDTVAISEPESRPATATTKVESAVGVSTIHNVGTKPKTIFPSVPSSPPKAPSRFNTPSRAALSPAKFDIAPRSTTSNSSNPYGAVRAALRPTSTGNRTDLSYDRRSSFMSGTQNSGITKPMGLFIVNKTPSDVAAARLADNPAESLPVPPRSVIGSSVSVASRISNFQNGITSSSVLGRERFGSIAGSDVKSDTKSAVKSTLSTQSRAMSAKENLPSTFSDAAPDRDPQKQRETWFRDQAFCGEAENEDDGTSSPAVMAKLEDHSRDHHELGNRIDGLSGDITNAMVGIADLVDMAREQGRPKPLDPELVERLNSLHETVQAAAAQPPEEVTMLLRAIGMDVRQVQAQLAANAGQAAALAPAIGEEAEEAEERDLPAGTGTDTAEPKLGEIHAKLDVIAAMLTTVLQFQGAAAGVAVEPAPVVEMKDEPSAGGKATAREAHKEPELPKEATTVPDVEIPKALEDPAPEAPKEAPPEAAPAPELATAAQLNDIEATLKELEEARATQTQQTQEIGTHLKELNQWLATFVQNSGQQLEGVSRKINNLVGEPGENDVPTGLVADIQSMVAEQSQQVAAGSMQAQRLDSLIDLMGHDREHHAQQQGMIEQILAAAQQSRDETVNLMRGLATDLTNEIKGERVRFIDSMRDATSMNMQIHVDQFKAAITQEMNRGMKELGMMREQKKALEHQIADLFALKAKHGDNPPHSPAPSVTPIPPPTPALGLPPAPGPRALPTPPH